MLRNDEACCWPSAVSEWLVFAKRGSLVSQKGSDDVHDCMLRVPKDR